MHWMIEKRSNYSVILFLVLIFSHPGVAVADECDELTQSVKVRLEDFLNKRLDFELFQKRQKLIASWKDTYSRFELVSDKFVDKDDSEHLEVKRIAAEQSENRYLKAFEKLESTCPGD